MDFPNIGDGAFNRMPYREEIEARANEADHEFASWTILIAAIFAFDQPELMVEWLHTIDDEELLDEFTGEDIDIIKSGLAHGIMHIRHAIDHHEAREAGRRGEN
jgi:hypothetical protein